MVVRPVGVRQRLHRRLRLRQLLVVRHVALLELLQLLRGRVVLALADAADDVVADQPLVDTLAVDAPGGAHAVRRDLVVVNRAPSTPIRARRQRQPQVLVGRVHVARANADELGLAAALEQLVGADGRRPQLASLGLLLEELRRGLVEGLLLRRHTVVLGEGSIRLIIMFIICVVASGSSAAAAAATTAAAAVAAAGAAARR